MITGTIATIDKDLMSTLKAARGGKPISWCAPAWE